MTEKKPSQVAPGTPPPAPAAAPADLAALASAGANLDAQAEPTQQQPGAPGGEQPKQPEMSSAELFLLVGGPWFDILAPNWKVQQSEKKQLADMYGALLDKYFPDWSTRFGPEIGCIVVSAAVFGPRIAMKVPARIEEQKKEEKKPDAAAAE